ncbi:hypothetical protein WJ13_10885 [Burkholderia seminalis]|nr:hypothetical protein WJ13_10885 [Burkholderia seminalis]
MESFFKTLKAERIYQTHYETRANARVDIDDWIEGYYNRQHLHTSIDFLTPRRLRGQLDRRMSCCT